MKYGLIGYPLKHSFSKEIHSLISDYLYDICELDENSFELFMKEKKFIGINVTIPYKQKVIPYLDFIDEDAKNINAVNTIINIDGKLYGYNTDILGILSTFSYFNIDIKNKSVLILGTGATSNTVKYALKKSNAKTIYKAYRENSKIKGDILYSDLDKLQNEIEIIINTTSNGMYPNANKDLLININRFTKLKTVFDVIYNPLRTKLLIEANNSNIKTISGLYMLVSQAYFASNLFTNKVSPKDFSLSHILNAINQKSSIILNSIESIYKKCLKSKQNIILSGMPTSGKTTLAHMISEKYDYEFIDTDELIENKINKKIADYINKYGEESFRNIESEVIKEISTKTHAVIATGGGAILRSENVLNLKFNGKIFFLNRSLNNLKASSDRPLTQDFESLHKKYIERLPIYKHTCDYEINADQEFNDRISNIMNNL